MNWIVVGEESGRIKLVSKSGTSGILPKGSYLTIQKEDTGSKFILRVDDTKQSEPFSPSPFVVQMDLAPLKQDQECQNLVYAYRVRDITNRTDGLIDFIPPQSVARKSTQDEIDQALGNKGNGPKVFLASIHASQNLLIRDESGKPLTARFPEDMFFHQILICGKTGSGKTVAMKYLAQYFVDELEGAVLAINVKDVDFLKMDRGSVATNPEVIEEWGSLGESPRGVDNFIVYYPANTYIDPAQGVTSSVLRKITLDVGMIEPEALTGLLQGISDTGVQSLPNIFRFWQNKMREKKKAGEFTFKDFIEYFSRAREDKRFFQTMNSRGDISEVTLHPGTFDNIARSLDFASEFFDNEDAIRLSADDILSPSKISVINVSGKKGIEFGSILLRDLLHSIVEIKDRQKSSIPILIVIDEVHQFYGTGSSEDALADLGTICRTGRSKKIAVIFSSQTPSDIPGGLASVINTKIFFRSDAYAIRHVGVKISDEELDSLKNGYAIGTIHELSQLRVMKFPMSLAGVFEDKRK